MALNNYIYTNNGTILAPLANSLQLGTQPLLYNLSSTQTSGAFPFMESKNVYKNIFIAADTWGDATVTIQVSLDGTKNWTTLNTFSGTPLSGITANTFAPIVLRAVYIRAIITTTSGVNVSAVLC